jgi:Fur family ferric uptake transcriptional regulator
MDITIDQLQTVLAADGSSMTAPRINIFRALQARGPLTMAELIQHVGASLDRASVYRSVTLFEKLGIVKRLQMGWKYRIELGDQFQPHHHHMYCEHCGDMVELPEDEVLEKRLYKLASLHGFVPSDHQIEMRGRCNNCQSYTKNISEC